MNTSGVDEPPEIAVASVARLVSVSVGADTSVTWIPGYCFSNALISTVRASLAPVPVSGLADQTMLPDVAEPLAELVGEATAVDEEPAAGELELPLRAPVPVVLLPLEPQAASASAPAAASAAATPPRRMKAMPCRLRDILPPGIAALLSGGNFVSHWMIWASWDAISESACWGVSRLRSAACTALEMTRLAWS